jgi:nucleotide-binding universal stress UspA family protein
MTMFRSILVPVDLAQRSSWQHALPQALELATAARGVLTVVTVVREISAIFEGVYLHFQLEQLLSDARTRLADVVSEYLPAAVPIDQDVRCGSIGGEILAAAKDHEADLIVMASHRPGVRDVVIGPHAAHVAQRAGCSVLVLRRFEEAPPPAREPPR